MPLRLFIFSLLAHLALLGFHAWRVDGDPVPISQKSDLHSFAPMADLILTGQMPDDPYHIRVFPGWPLAFAPFYALLHSLWTPILLAILLASLLPVQFWHITRNTAGSIIMALGTPTLFMHSTMGMSEPLFLALCFAALLCHTNQHSLLAGLSLGLAAWVRPVALFLWIGCAFDLARRRRWRALATLSATSGVIAASVTHFNLHLYGDPLHQVHRFSLLENVSAENKALLNLGIDDGSHFGLPFTHLIRASLLPGIPLWKELWIYGHVAALISVLAIGWPEFRRFLASRGDETRLPAIAWLWVFGNGLFILSTGPYWAFHTFDRYFTWALPGCLILAMPYLPGKALSLGVTSVGVAALSVWGLAK